MSRDGIIFSSLFVYVTGRKISKIWFGVLKIIFFGNVAKINFDEFGHGVLNNYDYK